MLKMWIKKTVCIYVKTYFERYFFLITWYKPIFSYCFMKCEASQRLYISTFLYIVLWNVRFLKPMMCKNPGLLRISSGHARHRFWYTEKMLNTNVSGLVTIRFYFIYLHNRFLTYYNNKRTFIKCSMLKVNCRGLL